MFEDLLELGKQRSGKQALGFYLAYLVLFIVVSAVLGGIAGGIMADSQAEAYDAGLLIGGLFSVLASITVSLLILRARKLHKNFLYVLYAFMAGVLALFGGGLFGLIIPSYLTTVPGAAKK